MKDLKMVYNFVDRYPNFGLYFLILLFVAFTFGIFYYHKELGDSYEITGSGMSERTHGMVMGILFFTVALVVAAIIIPRDIKEYIETQEVFDNKQYKIVEGRVSNFQTYGKLAIEQFDVTGVHFDFSDDSDYGYHGGAIKANLYVQIYYFDNGTKNVILELKTE